MANLGQRIGCALLWPRASLEGSRKERNLFGRWRPLPWKVMPSPVLGRLVFRRGSDAETGIGGFSEIGAMDHRRLEEEKRPTGGRGRARFSGRGKRAGRWPVQTRGSKRMNDGPLRGERTACGRATSIGSRNALKYSTEGASHRESGIDSRSVPASHVTSAAPKKAKWGGTDGPRPGPGANEEMGEGRCLTSPMREKAPPNGQRARQGACEYSSSSGCGRESLRKGDR
jgi:hypothetical protein